mmetsp:Transcript_25487/g.64226  ORF Transcript_25487/g.64226 Transcript_25487/m.64226 type:complete len:205 (+) Transcript_25487:2695-3309(+)
MATSCPTSPKEVKRRPRQRAAQPGKRCHHHSSCTRKVAQQEARRVGQPRTRIDLRATRGRRRWRAWAPRTARAYTVRPRVPGGEVGDEASTTSKGSTSTATHQRPVRCTTRAVTRLRRQEREAPGHYPAAYRCNLTTRGVVNRRAPCPPAAAALRQGHLQQRISTTTCPRSTRPRDLWARTSPWAGTPVRACRRTRRSLGGKRT